MATAAAGRTRCIICDKDKATWKCGGCLQDFCFNHSTDHRQELSKQLDEVEVTRDLFRQTLSENKADPRKHSLIQQIIKWENDSINKIRETAEEATQILFKHTAEIHTSIEDKLNNLTDQLRQSRLENDFFETDLKQWKEELTQMQNELTKPPNITIRQDSTPLVTKINVDISNDKGRTKSEPNAKIDTTGKASDSDRVVPCSFCKEEFPSSNMGEHLMMCGNKTDQCPRCKQFVRRAISAYHHENDCTNPDAFDEPSNSAADRPNTLLASHWSEVPHSRSGSSVANTRDNRQILTNTSDATSYHEVRSIMSRRSNSEERRMVVECPFCDEQVDQIDLQVHMEMCDVDPNNITKNRRQSDNRQTNQNSNRLKYVNESDVMATIPCEYCTDLVDWLHYDAHTKACAERGDRRRQLQSGSDDVEDDGPVRRCKYCNKMHSVSGSKFHEMSCARNPANKT